MGVAKMNKLFIGTNLKMYKTASQTVDYLTKLEELTKNIDMSEMELFVIPSYTSLESAAKCLKAKSIKLGAQNMCWEDQGQFTGEVSPLMLNELNIDIIEIGHSERRHVFGETDAEINKKVLAALKHGFTALLCIGETEEQKRYGVSDECLRMQLKTGLYGVMEKETDRLWVAYEPVWAIGVNGIPASPEYADSKQAVIKSVLKEMFGEFAERIPVLYGGSVNSQNARYLISMPSIDGLFIGRSAWDAQNFRQIIDDVLPVFWAKKNNRGIWQGEI